MNEKAKRKSGFVLSIIGRQECGKTPVIKKLVENSKFKRVIVYDPNYEYSDTYSLFHSLEIFRDFIFKAEKSFIIVEEATSFLSSFKDIQLQDLCVKIAHKNNICIFVFHTLMDAPKSILNKSRNIILFATLDDANDIKTQRNRYFKFFSLPNENKPVFIDNYNI